MTPYYQAGGITIFHGDCLAILPELAPADAVVTDPPYGETALEWDVSRSYKWLGLIPADTKTLWCFGSMRYFMQTGFSAAGWNFAQDIVWEKHNGSSFHADRFKRVHEHVVQFYRGPWAEVFKAPQFTADATKRTVRRKQLPPHLRTIGESHYTSHDGGPRLMRSVLRVPSCHGKAWHPTQKPISVLVPILRYSVPAGGSVLDPFAGSGSTAVAAKALGLRCTLIEISEPFCEAAAERLRQEVLDFTPETGRP